MVPYWIPKARLSEKSEWDFCPSEWENLTRVTCMSSCYAYCNYLPIIDIVASPCPICNYEVILCWLQDWFQAHNIACNITSTGLYFSTAFTQLALIGILSYVRIDCLTAPTCRSRPTRNVTLNRGASFPDRHSISVDWKPQACGELRTDNQYVWSAPTSLDTHVSS